MSETSVAEAQRLIHEGRAAALAGDSMSAREAFRQATELDPGNAEGWVGLSGVVPILAEKRRHLLRALEFDPGSAEAQASLAYVERLIGEGLQIAPSQRVSLRERINPPAEPAAPVEVESTEPVASTDVMYCYIHPDRETGLRCIQCARPICGSCAQVTSVGQLCPECRKARRPANYKVDTRELVVAGLTAGAVAALCGALVATVPNFGIFINLFLGLLAGTLIVRAVDRTTRSKRGRPIQIAVGAGIILGAILGGMFGMTAAFFVIPEFRAMLAANGVGLLTLLPTTLIGAATNSSLLVFAIVSTVSAVGQLR